MALAIDNRTKNNLKNGFTMIELLAGITIIAVLVTFGIVYIGGYVQTSKQQADKQTLFVLNDALNRYKCEGGDVNALTSGAPITNVIAKLQEPITWAGMTHSVLQGGKTYLGRSIYALGDKKQYRFTQFNTYAAETGGRTTTNLDSGLVGWWKFDEGSGTSVADSSGNGNNGNLSSTPPSFTTGKKNYALSFGGLHSFNYVNLGNSTALNPSIFTISAWIKISNHYFYNYIFSNSRDCCGTYNGIEFHGIDDGRLIGSIWNGSSFYIYSLTSLSTNTWYHVTFSYDGSTLKLYINGNLDASVNSNLGVGSPASYNSCIGTMGYDPDWYIFNGLIDDVRIYNRALSEIEVQQLYNQ